MTDLSDQNRLQSQKLAEIATRHGVSLDAVMAILDAMRGSGGRMAQFSHPELGGMGQWSSGMLMIGEMSNSALKQKVQSLCDELSRLTEDVGLDSGVNQLGSLHQLNPIKALEHPRAMDPIKPLEHPRAMDPIKPLEHPRAMDPIKSLEHPRAMDPIKPMESIKPMEPMKPMKPMEPMKPFKPFDNIQWWPTSLGAPSSVGSQNESRYAYFSETNRLAIEQNSRVTVFDTGDHKISGASQAQGDTELLAFQSQLGRVLVSELKEIPG